MSTKNSTPLYNAAIDFRRTLGDSDLKGPKTDQIQDFLRQLIDRLAPQQPAPKPIDPRLQSQPRKPRTGPPAQGLFRKREAQITLGPHKLQVTSITQAESLTFALTQKHPKITTAEVATAIQAAYPTNNYSEQRVISAFKKFQRTQKQEVAE